MEKFPAEFETTTDPTTTTTKSSSKPKWLLYENNKIDGMVPDTEDGLSSASNPSTPPSSSTTDNTTSSSSTNGFKWRRGGTRMTTGMWMYSKPFFLPYNNKDSDTDQASDTMMNDDNSINNNRIAVLLTDTQGLFDNTMTENLSVSIFGLATLMSSYSIYNVRWPVGEDTMTKIAAFTGQARTVAKKQSNTNGDDDEENKGIVSNLSSQRPSSSSSSNGTPTSNRPSRQLAKQKVGNILQSADKQTGSNNNDTNDTTKELINFDTLVSPFQRFEFLVRDSQYALQPKTPNVLTETTIVEREMTDKLEELFLASAHNSELRDKRMQLLECFDHISYFMLPSPGDAVVDGEINGKEFDGDVNLIKDRFCTMLDLYVRVVFKEQLEPKRVSNRDIRGKDYFEFVKSCAEHYANGAPGFFDLFSAMAKLINNGAYEKAMKKYNSSMRAKLGGNYVMDDIFDKAHELSYKESLQIFDKQADFGPSRFRNEKKNQLLESLENRRKEYFEENLNRNPHRIIQPILFAITTIFCLYILRIFIDFTCGPYWGICSRLSTTLYLTNWVLTITPLAIAYTKGMDTVLNILQAFTNVAGTVASQSTANPIISSLLQAGTNALTQQAKHSSASLSLPQGTPTKDASHDSDDDTNETESKADPVTKSSLHKDGIRRRKG